MTVDSKIHAIATLFVDQLLAEITPPTPYGFSAFERNAYIEQTEKALQQAIEDECQTIRDQIRMASESPF